MALANRARKANTAPEKPSLVRELVEIADYIAHLRTEIAALRPAPPPPMTSTSHGCLVCIACVSDEVFQERDPAVR